MILLNFAHPLTLANLEEIERLAGKPVSRLVELPVQFNAALPFDAQIISLMAALPVSPQELQTEAILVNLPSFNYIAALLLAYLHGLMGRFPAIIRLRAEPDSPAPQYQAVEVINLQSVRELARSAR